MLGGKSLYLQFDFEMFEKCKARTGDWLVVIRGQRRRLELRDHQGSSAGTGQALGLNLAGHLGPQSSGEVYTEALRSYSFRRGIFPA